MAYVKASISPRAKKFLATAEGRKDLLELYLDGKFVTANKTAAKSPASAKVAAKQ